MGLGAALLSDEGHAHVKTGGYRPLDIKMIMATLVVQRALKRNVKKRKKLSLYDVLRAAEGKARESRTYRRPSVRNGSNAPNHTALGLRGSGNVADTRRLSSTGQLSDTGQGILTGQQQQQQRGARSRAGSMVLPPDADESKWLMRRFLVDLQLNNERSEEEPVLLKNRSGSRSLGGDGVGDGVGGDGDEDAASGNARGRAKALRLLNSNGSGGGSSKAQTEIGSPAPGTPPARMPNRPKDGDCVEDGRLLEERSGQEEEKVEETSVTSLAIWLRGHSSVDL